jgi:hypothetical protein
MNGILQERYHRPIALAGLAWLAIVSAMALVDHGHWRHVAAQAQSGASIGQFEALEARVAAVESQEASQKQQPKPLSAALFAERSRALEERLTRLEQTTSRAAAEQELEVLAGRVNALEAARAHPGKTDIAAAPKRTSTVSSAAPPAPPFRVLGTELRGGELFLAIAPPRTVSLAEMSVLRVGDVEDGWQLVGLDARSATFQFQGQSRRLELQ